MARALSWGLTLVGMSAAIVVLLKEILMFMRVARIPSAALGVLALGILAWTAPVLSAAGQTERDAQQRPIATVIPCRRGGNAPGYGPLPARRADRADCIYTRRPIRGHDNGKLGLQVWDARDGRKVRRLDIGVDNIHDFAFSPDGKTLAATCFGLDRQKRLIVHRLIFTDFASGREISTDRRGARSAALRLAFAPDGKTIATIGDMLRFWDVSQRQAVVRGKPGPTRTP